MITLGDFGDKNILHSPLHTRRLRRRPVGGSQRVESVKNAVGFFFFTFCFGGNSRCLFLYVSGCRRYKRGAQPPLIGRPAGGYLAPGRPPAYPATEVETYTHAVRQDRVSNPNNRQSVAFLLLVFIMSFCDRIRRVMF